VGGRERRAVDMAHISVGDLFIRLARHRRAITDALQFRLMIPTTRPVGCLSEMACFVSERKTLDSRANASVSSTSSSESSTSSSLSVAMIHP
jgi:hypothetical protein